MDSKESKPQVSWFKKWWHDWAKIDLTVLPLGIVLAYFLHAYADGFWINLSTELIGAYISVRFIDYLLRRTEIRHHKRRELVGNVHWFYERANDLSPYFDEDLLKDLTEEIDAFDAIWDKNEKRIDLLFEDEISIVNKVRASRNIIVEYADKYIEAYKSLRKTEKEIEEKISVPPLWWRRLEEQFREFRRTTIKAREVISATLEYAITEAGKPSDLPKDQLELLMNYLELINNLISYRETVEEEVKTHKKLHHDLRVNVYQESG